MTRVHHAESGGPHVMVCFGTRPEVVKLAPVIAELDRHEDLQVSLVTTAQHREMLDQMLATFDLEPTVDLHLMRPDQSLADLTGRAVESLGRVIKDLRPDAVLVQGDTTTVFCAALAAFYERIPVGHVEAGLRTNDPYRPFPEEINRRLVSEVARWHFCPTERAAEKLRNESIDPESIQVTGNTVVDALLSVAEGAASDQRAVGHLPDKSARRRLLVTLHRRETQGEAQRRLCEMLARLARRDDLEIVFPVHLSPTVRASVFPMLGDIPNVHLMDPVGYVEFVHLMQTSDIIVTDSGGVQEEAPALDVPVLVMRDTTERPEGVDAGCALLAGTVPENVEREILRLLEDEDAYRRMAEAPNPYGDGKSAARIVQRLRADLLGEEPEELSAA